MKKKTTIKVITKEGRVVDILRTGTCLACELGIPHKVKQNRWCKVRG